MAEQQQSCGTCKWWKCLYECCEWHDKSRLPECVTRLEKKDVRAMDGATCPCFEPKETKDG